MKRVQRGVAGQMDMTSWEAQCSNFLSCDLSPSSAAPYQGGTLPTPARVTGKWL